jgi:hypothetical protein
MTTIRCDGWVRSLHGQTLAFTGKVLIDGTWTLREDCAASAMTRGAVDWKADFSRKVALLVHGDLARQVVTDDARRYSKKLVRAAWERDRGYHVCVVDADGFSGLLNRTSALPRAPAGPRDQQGDTRPASAGRRDSRRSPGSAECRSTPSIRLGNRSDRTRPWHPGA